MDLIQTLIVCEKPDAAGRVARALDDDNDPRRTNEQGVPLYEARRGKEIIFVCTALGHLYAVDSKARTSRRFYPVWDNAWKSKNLIDRESSRLAKWIQTISRIAQDSDRFINACDYDVEGSLIGYTVLRYACNNAHSDAERMKFSTMTENELRTAYKTRASHLDFSQAEAGRCRHELDWLYGINLSRVLTESTFKQNKGYATLSTGRVQGPTLKFVVVREEEIQCHAPTPYWKIEATIVHEGKTYEIDFEKERVGTQVEASQIVKNCRNAILEVTDLESKKIQQAPPYPFDLSSLQAEAYRHLGYSPSRTLALAETLYLEALISYPRTSSQKLPPEIDYTEILKGLNKYPSYRVLASRLAAQSGIRPNQGPKQDPAHPAVYPTGESPKRSLLEPETKLLDLVIRRFMSTFAEASLRENTRITLEKDQYHFFLRGSRLVREGWVEYYRPYAHNESQDLPGLRKDDRVLVHKIDSTEKFTEPPPRYNPGSLLRRMEDENIGTKATRAEIIDTLYRRGYIKENRIQTTPLALKVASILERYCPLITDSDFTAGLENKMELIQQERMSRTEVLTEALEHLRTIMHTLIEREGELGSQLSEIVAAQRTSNITFSYPCPSCNSKLMIIRSRGSGKRFIGCTGYQSGCRFTLPLPQFGALTISRRSCKTCGFQQVMVRSRGRRPLISCPRCYKNKSKVKRGATDQIKSASPLTAA